MLAPEQVAREIAAYRLKLLALGDRYLAGERSTLGAETLACADALTCLLEEAPPEQRPAIDYLIDRYEALRASCSN
jgi:hypothetical protein